VLLLILVGVGVISLRSLVVVVDLLKIFIWDYYRTSLDDFSMEVLIFTEDTADLSAGFSYIFAFSQFYYYCLYSFISLAFEKIAQISDLKQIESSNPPSKWSISLKYSWNYF